MSEGLKFKDLAVATDLNSLLGVAENADGVTAGNKFTYSSDTAMSSDSKIIISTQYAVKTYVDTGLSGKEPTLTKGNLTESTSSILTITNGTNAVIGTGTTIEVKQADAKTSGYLSGTDYGNIAFKNASNAFSAAQSIAATDPVSMATSQMILKGTAVTGAANTGAALTLGGHNGVTATNWAQISGYKKNSTLGNNLGELAFVVHDATTNEVLAATLSTDTFGVANVSATNLKLTNSGHVATYSSGVLGGDIAITGPTATGILALTSDITTAISNLLAATNVWTGVSNTYNNGIISNDDIYLEDGYLKIRAGIAQNYYYNVGFSGAPAANRKIYAWEAGADSYLVLSEGAQTINGNKTLTGTTTCGTSGTSGIFTQKDSANNTQNLIKAATDSYFNATNGKWIAIGTDTPTTTLTLSQKDEPNADVTDSYTNAITLSPRIDDNSMLVHTITRYNYFVVNQPLMGGLSAATVTDSCLFRFNPDGGGNYTVLDAGTTKTTPTAVDDWIIVSKNGTLRYIPTYASKTA